MNKHKGIKPHVCTDDPANCDFATRDPASLTRHRRRRHGYVPLPRKGRKRSAKVEIKYDDELAVHATPPEHVENAVAGPSSHPTALETQTVTTPPVAVSPSLDSDPGYTSSSESFSSESRSDNAGTSYSLYIALDDYASDYTGITPMTTPSSQTHPLPELPMFSVDPLEYEVPQFNFKDDSLEEPEPLDVFTKDPSYLLYDVDPTVTGMPNAWIDAQCATLSTSQSFEPLPLPPVIMADPVPTPVFHLEDYHRDAWTGFPTTLSNGSHSQYLVWD